jgi:hypothetical protein
MYAPLVKAFNYALGRLSELDVPGLPQFEEKRQIVFACSDAKCIMSEDYLHGSYKPDIILVKWDVFKKTHKHTSAAYSESYESSICYKSGRDRPALGWHNILSTVEVKRGGSGRTGSSGNNRSKGKAKEQPPEPAYSKDFGGLQGDIEGPGPSKLPQSAAPKMVSEEYPTRSRMSAVFRR